MCSNSAFTISETMTEPPFSPTSEEPDGATVKEEPEDSCISFDEKPLQLEGKLKSEGPLVARIDSENS